MLNYSNFFYLHSYNVWNCYRYRLQWHVYDDVCNYANFMVWDQECRNIIGISAEDLQKKMIKVNILNINPIIDFVIAD